MSKPVILTGLRANNDLHIGNYFGALLPLIDMAKNRAEEYQINLFVPDLHSFTTPIDHSQLQAQIMHNLRLFAAAGLPLDHPDIHIYRQSYVPAHSELTWILDCFTGFGEMNRMTQFKDKSQQLISDDDVNKNTEYDYKTRGLYSNSTSVGLFNYPVLMATDILLYGAEYVPVGDDQSQHIEFTRDIAERMNSKFGELFTALPKPVKEQHEFFGKDQGLRIKDLTDPSKKMSKSDDSAKGVIFLGDDPEEAAKKVMSATTDSESNIKFDFATQPGVSNLLQIQSLLRGQPLEETIRHWEGKSGYGDLKREVGDAVRDFLIDFQERLKHVDENQLMAKLVADEQAMNEVANATLLKVQQAVGLRAS
jgi:tryptophanyl-tRNA synthetase